MKKLLVLLFLSQFIWSCTTNSSGNMEINWGFLLFLGIIGFFILLSIRATKKEEEKKNLEEQIWNQRRNPNSGRLYFAYTKFKFTNEILFKDIQIASADVYKDCFDLNIYPYTAYSGRYLIIQSQKVRTGVLNTVIKEEYSNFSQYGSKTPCFIHISETGSTLKIFDENRVGIILKF